MDHLGVQHTYNVVVFRYASHTNVFYYFYLKYSTLSDVVARAYSLEQQNAGRGHAGLCHA